MLASFISIKEDFHYIIYNYETYNIIILILQLLFTMKYTIYFDSFFFFYLLFSIFDSIRLTALSAHLIIVKLYLLISEIEIFNFFKPHICL